MPVVRLEQLEEESTNFGFLPTDAIERGVVPVIMTTFSKFAASAGSDQQPCCQS